MTEHEYKLAMALLNSERGRYIVSQALHYGIKALESVEPLVHREQSNIADMKLLRWKLFPYPVEDNELSNDEIQKMMVKICDNCLFGDQPIGMTIQVVEQGDGTCEWDGCTEKEVPHNEENRAETSPEIHEAILKHTARAVNIILEKEDKNG